MINFAWKKFCNFGGGFFSTFSAVCIAIATNLLGILSFDNKDINNIRMLYILVIILLWLMCAWGAYIISKKLRNSETDYLKIEIKTPVAIWVFNDTNEDKPTMHIYIILLSFSIAILSMFIYRFIF